MDKKKTAFMEMTRVGEPDAKTELVEVYVHDGTPVSPELRERHLAAVPEESQEIISIARTHLADMIAAAAAAAVAAHKAKSATPETVTDAARAALGVE